jgi:hypothetical protein
MRLHQQGRHLLPYVRYFLPKEQKSPWHACLRISCAHCIRPGSHRLSCGSRCFARGSGKKAGTADGAPAPVANTSKVVAAREVKASKECSLATAVANTLKAPVVREVKASKECSLAMADNCHTRGSGCRIRTCHKGAWSFSSGWCCGGDCWDGGG